MQIRSQSKVSCSRGNALEQVEGDDDVASKIRFKYSCCFAFSASLKCDKMVVSVLDHELEIIRAQRKSLFFLRVEYKVKD